MISASFPRIQKELLENMLDSWHRARDLMHTDKTEHSIKMSKVISRYIALLREMHDIICNVQLDDKLADEKGAIIQQITRIERNEDVHFLFEDADFSVDTIKKLIKQGEKDTENILATN